MKKFMKKLDNKGFTLVELIIVIAIIAVLAAVLAPQYVKYIDRSRQGVDANTLSEVFHNVEVETGLIEKIDASSTVTITASADKKTGTVSGTGSFKADSAALKHVQEVVGNTVNFKSNAITAGEVYTISISDTTSKASWDTTSGTKVTALQNGSASATTSATATK